LFYGDKVEEKTGNVNTKRNGKIKKAVTALILFGVCVLIHAESFGHQPLFRGTSRQGMVVIIPESRAGAWNFPQVQHWGGSIEPYRRELEKKREERLKVLRRREKEKEEWKAEQLRRLDAIEIKP
jgi:hypothetical protein